MATNETDKDRKRREDEERRKRKRPRRDTDDKSWPPKNMETKVPKMDGAK